MEILIISWENQSVLYNVSNPQNHMNEARSNAIVKIIDYYSPSFDDSFKKINALRFYFVVEKNKMAQSKTNGAGSSGI